MKDFKMKGIESKDGIVKLFGERIVFIPPNIISLLGQIYGDGSKPLLKYLGKKMGRRLIETWEEHIQPNTIEELTNLFLDMMSASGWGLFTAELISDELIVITLKYNISQEEGSFTKDICYFINGLLTGFGDFALYNVNVTESDCSLTDTNNEVCRFEIQKRKIEL
jgi:predicted hydrocarbon binding protein